MNQQDKEALIKAARRYVTSIGKLRYLMVALIREVKESQCSRDELANIFMQANNVKLQTALAKARHVELLASPENEPVVKMLAAGEINIDRAVKLVTPRREKPRISDDAILWFLVCKAAEFNNARNVCSQDRFIFHCRNAYDYARTRKAA
jgi:hypothetical protein